MKILLIAFSGFMIGNLLIGMAYFVYTNNKSQEITSEEYWKLWEDKQIDSITHRNGIEEIETIDGKYYFVKIGSTNKLLLSVMSEQNNAANRKVKIIVKPDSEPIKTETIFKMAPFYIMSFTMVVFSVWFIFFRKKFLA